MYNMQKEKDLFHQIENEIMMTDEQMHAFYEKHAYDGYLVVTENREYPLHNVFNFPSRWLKRNDLHTFSATVQPGEYYAFQLALFSSEDNLGPVEICSTGINQEMTCFNAGGTDCFGNLLKKEITVKKNHIQPLWFGIDIPEDFKDPCIQGTLTITPSNRKSTIINISIGISGEVPEDRGDSEPWRHSRLRWLNSRVAIDDELTSPFSPLQVKKKRIKGLGHTLLLSENGMPSCIQSMFSPSVEYLTLTGRDILAAPIRFDVKTCCSCNVQPELKKPVTFTEIKDGVVRWQSEQLSKDVSIVCNAEMQYDGFMEYKMTVEAINDVDIDDICLNIPYKKDAAKYWMGLGERGGYRQKDLDWKWNVEFNQDTMWMGDVNAGLMVRLKCKNFQKPFMLIYYHYHPIVLPECWDNNGKGGCRVKENEDHVSFEAYSGARHLKKGEKLEFDFDLSITPVKPINKVEHWQDHYFHDVPQSLKEVSKGGANIINIHHAKELNPFINYPFFETKLLADFVNNCHENGIRAKIYYTVKELSVRTPEFWAFRSLGDEIIPSTYEIGSSFQGSVPYADEWMKKYIGENYITAWRQIVNDGKYKNEMEASVVVAPMSRFNNYFLEGLLWVLENTGIDGLYFDDVAFDRSIMKRIRKILDRHHPGCTIDLHSWNYYKNNTVDNSRLAGWGNSMNLYIDNYAFIDRIWFGEGFDYSISPDGWLIEMSGIPFGMMGEMLQNGGNVWRGMVFGMTNRLPNEKNPSGMWELWKTFNMANATMLGYWNPACPVKTNLPDIPVTVYKQPHQCMLSLASWADSDQDVYLQVDFEALGLDPARAELTAPEIEGFQEGRTFKLDEPVHVPAGKGWVILLTEK